MMSLCASSRGYPASREIRMMGWHPSFDRNQTDELLVRIERVAQAAAVAERAACADICDQHASVEGIAQRCAEQIRARSKT